MRVYPTEHLFKVKLDHVKMFLSQVCSVESMISERDVIKRMAAILYGGQWRPEDVTKHPIGKERFIISSIDSLVASTDVPEGTSLRSAARKAAVAVVSDFASKGVNVEAMLFSISLPSVYTSEGVEEIAKGLRDAAQEYSFQILGGDTNEAKDLVITCCGIGTSHGQIPRRSGSKPGDILAVTGLFGLHPLGLWMLKSSASPRTPLESLAVERLLRPKARAREGVLAASSGALTASIDSSDGLLQSLYEIAENSGVKLLLDFLPAYPGLEEAAERLRLSVDKLVLEGGEEYELVFTVKRDGWNSLKASFDDRGLDLYEIGRVEVGSDVYLLRSGGYERLERGGWEHFKEMA
jgi:thiamine-monophosphate kinase